MVFFHAHESGIRVCFGIAVAPGQLLFLLLVLIQVIRPVLFSIIKLLLYPGRNILFILYGLIDSGDHLFYFGGIYRALFYRISLFEFFGCYPLGIVPQIIELLSYPFFTGLDAVSPNKGIAVCLCFYLGAIGKDSLF